MAFTFMFVSEPTEVPGLGTLQPLTLKQMAELRVEIQRDLMLLVSQGLAAAEKGYAAAAIAMQVAEMNRFKQASFIANSPMLTAHAVAKMLGKNEPTAAAVLIAKITPAMLESVAEAVVGSYGFKMVETKEDEPKDEGSDPTTTDGSSEAAAS